MHEGLVPTAALILWLVVSSIATARLLVSSIAGRGLFQLHRHFKNHVYIIGRAEHVLRSRFPNEFMMLVHESNLSWLEGTVADVIESSESSSIR